MPRRGKRIEKDSSDERRERYASGMEGHRSIPSSIIAIGAVAVGIALNAADFPGIGGEVKTFAVAVIAGFAATLAGRAAKWRLRGE